MVHSNCCFVRYVKKLPLSLPIIIAVYSIDTKIATRNSFIEQYERKKNIKQPQQEKRIEAIRLIYCIYIKLLLVYL